MSNKIVKKKIVYTIGSLMSLRDQLKAKKAPFIMTDVLLDVIEQFIATKKELEIAAMDCTKMYRSLDKIRAICTAAHGFGFYDWGGLLDILDEGMTIKLKQIIESVINEKPN